MHGGGIAAFIKSEIPARRRKDLEIEHLENICYEVPRVNSATYASELKLLMDMHGSQFAQIDVQMAELDLRFQILETASYDGTLMWKLSDYTRRKQDAVQERTLSLYCQPFYTHRYGYKMCAQVYLNGDGMGKESRISLFFVMMRGFSQQPHVGTAIKFNPSLGQDALVKNEVTKNTKYQCITAMKEYEGKSLGAGAEMPKVQMSQWKCSGKRFALKELCLETSSNYSSFLLTNKGAHTYNGNGRTSRYNTRASKGRKKEKSDSFTERRYVNEAKRYRKDENWNSQFKKNTQGMQGATNGSSNFRKTHVTFGPFPASLISRSAESLNSVGALEGGKCTGTVFRVGSRYGMTAAHVIDSIINPHDIEGCEDLNQLIHCGVRFHEQEQIFSLKPVLHFKDDKLDVAVVEFGRDHIRGLPPPLQLVKFDVSTTLKAAVIIGYGNPAQSGKFLELGVDVMQQDDIPKKEIIKYIDQHKKTFRTVLKIYGSCADIVETGYSGCEADTHMILNCIMGQGASGSPVFTTEFPESLKVAGLFICGYPKMYYEFPESMQKRFPLKYTFEAATKTSAIYDAMCKHDKTKIAKAIFGC